MYKIESKTIFVAQNDNEFKLYKHYSLRSTLKIKLVHDLCSHNHVLYVMERLPQYPCAVIASDTRSRVF